MDISVPRVGILLLDKMLIGCCGSKTCYYALAQLYVEVQAFILVPLSRVFELKKQRGMIRDVYSHQSRIFRVEAFKHFLSLDPAARFEFMSLCWMGGAENVNFKLHRGVDILRVLLYMHVHRLGAAGVSIRPPS